MGNYSEIVLFKKLNLELVPLFSDPITYIYIHIYRDSRLNRTESGSLTSLARQ